MDRKHGLCSDGEASRAGNRNILVKMGGGELEELS